jgi:hypothetical protein
MWNMSFDGAVSRKGVGTGGWINPPKVGTKLCSYKLSFGCTNNMAEYEALILGLRTLKELAASYSFKGLIPPHGEKWFKGMPLEILCYKEFIKPNCLNGKIGVGIPG